MVRNVYTERKKNLKVLYQYTLRAIYSQGFFQLLLSRTTTAFRILRQSTDMTVKGVVVGYMNSSYVSRYFRRGSYKKNRGLIQSVFENYLVQGYSLVALRNI